MKLLRLSPCLPICLSLRPPATGMLALLLDELGDQSRPAGLVARAESRAGVGVEVLVEQHVAAPVRVVLEGRLLAEDCAPPSRIGHEDLDQPPRKLAGDLAQRQVCARAGR